MFELLALLLPLSLDTFAVAAALGVTGLADSERLRLSLLFAGFEAGMPLLGVGVGHGLGHTLGSSADYLASAALLALGASLAFGGEDDELDTAARLSRAHGLALVALGVGVSLDELAIGFSAGLLRLPVGWAIALIAVQAFLAAQLGLRFGGRVGERMRRRAERVAGFALLGLGIFVIAARLA